MIEDDNDIRGAFMNRKKIWLGIATGLVVLIGEFYYLFICADEQGMTFALLSGAAAVVTNIRYQVEYDRRMRPKSQYEGWFPHFEEGQPELNALGFNFWKWVLLIFTSGLFLILGTYTKK